MNAVDAAVRCRGLVRRFADVTAVDDVDLDVGRGECFGLLGPNGAGKTTTVEMLEGLGRPDAGSIEVLGESWGRRGDRKLRTRLGVQLQETLHDDWLTVGETVSLFRSFHKGGAAPSTVTATVGLTEKTRARVGKLSGGQRQRLTLACALVGEPEMLFLDEPTTGLDPQARLRIWEIVEAFRAGGGTVLMTTHNMEEAARLCTRVGIMDRGRIIALDTPEALIKSLGARQVIEIEANGLDEAALAALPAVSGVRRKGNTWTLTVTRRSWKRPVG